MDWNPLPLVIVMYAIGGLGGIVGFIVGGATREEGNKETSNWLLTIGGCSLLVFVAAAVMHGFIR